VGDWVRVPFPKALKEQDRWLLIVSAADRGYRSFYHAVGADKRLFSLQDRYIQQIAIEPKRILIGEPTDISKLEPRQTIVAKDANVKLAGELIGYPIKDDPIDKDVIREIELAAIDYATQLSRTEVSYVVDYFLPEDSQHCTGIQSRLNAEKLMYNPERIARRLKAAEAQLASAR
jgi:hypothetical protein